jgi:hypothetical protein
MNQDRKHQDKQLEPIHEELQIAWDEDGKLMEAWDAKTYEFWLDNDDDEYYERKYRDKI